MAGDAVELSEEGWDRSMDVGLKAMFRAAKYAIPHMRQAGGGSIVNISSISGIIAIGAPAYNASKGAVRVFTKVTAVEHAKDKIRCNSIHPGPIDTAMLQSGHEDPEAAMQRRLSAIPLGRLGTTEDIAYGALYLASDESSFVTGAELVIDGGFIAQ